MRVEIIKRNKELLKQRLLQYQKKLKEGRKGGKK